MNGSNGNPSVTTTSSSQSDYNVTSVADIRATTNRGSVIMSGVRARMRLRTNPNTIISNGAQSQVNTVTNAMNDFSINGGGPPSLSSPTSTPNGSAAVSYNNGISPTAGANSSSTGAIRRNTVWEQQRPQQPQQQTQIQQQRLISNGAQRAVAPYPQQVMPQIPVQIAVPVTTQQEGAAAVAAVGAASAVANTNGAMSLPQATNPVGNPAPVSSTTDQQLQAAQTDDEPLPAGWEIRFDQYGRRYSFNIWKIFRSKIIFLVDITLIIIHVLLIGKNLHHYHLVGKFVKILEVVYTM